MAGLFGKSLLRASLKAQTCQKVGTAHMSSQSRAEAFKKFLKKNKLALAAGTVTSGAVGLGVALTTAVSANLWTLGIELHPPQQPWSHDGPFASFDVKSIRRGYQVYKQVCAACHSMEYIHYRDFVGVFMTEDEAKAEAAEAMITDGPNDNGEMFQRPGKLFDTLPPPYPNKKAAMQANNGAYPPDLSYVSVAREGGNDYIFSLLTGYCDPPAGMEPNGELHYNPYFPGGWIAMAQALYNEIIEYEDGTPASTSQLAKDVSTFLAWSAEPHHDKRKQAFLRAIPMFAIAFAGVAWLKRSRQIVFRSRVMKKRD